MKSIIMPPLRGLDLDVLVLFCEEYSEPLPLPCRSHWRRLSHCPLSAHNPTKTRESIPSDIYSCISTRHQNTKFQKHIPKTNTNNPCRDRARPVSTGVVGVGFGYVFLEFCILVACRNTGINIGRDRFARLGGIMGGKGAVR